MIVVATTPVALHAPPADIAVLFGIGVGQLDGGFRQGALQSAFDLAEIGGIRTHAKSLRLEVRPRSDYMHLCRRVALGDGEQIRVQAKLEDGAATRLTCQL